MDNLLSLILGDDRSFAINARRRLAVIGAMFVGLGSCAQATTQTWTSTSSTVWTTAANWNNGSGPAPGSSDIASFNLSSYAGSIATGGSVSINGLQIGSSSGALAIAGGMTLGSGGITIASGASTFSFDVGNSTALSASQQWNNNSSSLFIYGNASGTLKGNSTTTAVTLTLAGSGSGGTTFNGIIADDGTATGGTTALTVNTTGSGTTTLAAANSFTGGLSLQGGNLLASGSSGNVLGKGALSLSGGTLVLDSTTTGLTYAATSLSVSGNAAITLDRPTAAAGSYGFNNVSIGTSTLTVNGGSTATSAVLTLGATGGVTLTGNATFTLNPGTSSGNPTVTLGALNDGGTARTITLNGTSGTLVMSTAATTVTSGETVNIGSGDTLALGGSAVTSALGTGVTNISDSGAFNVGVVATDSAGANVLSLTGSGTVNLKSANNNLTVSNSSADSFTGNIGGAGSLTEAGSSVLTLSGSNSYTGSTTITSGNLTMNGSTSASSAVAVGNGSAVATLAGTGTLNGSVTTTTSGTNVAHLAPGSTAGSAGTLHIGGNLTVAAGSELDMDLSASNSSGNDLLSMNGGTLTIGNLVVDINELSSAGTLTTGTGSANGYVLISDFSNGGTLTLPTLTTNFSGSGTVVSYTASYSIVQVGTNNYNLVVNFASSGNTTPSVAYFNGAGTDMNTATNYSTDATGATTVSGLPGSSTDVYFATNGNTRTNPNLSAALEINSLTFGAGAGTNSGITVSSTNPSDTLKIDAGATANDTTGAGVTVLSGSDTISAPVIMGATQNWNVAASGTLTDAGGITGSSGQTLTLNGPGAFKFTSGSTTGAFNTTVSSGARLLLGNGSNGSALGTGTLTVQKGATIGGAGQATAMAAFNIGSGGSGTAQVLVGAGGTDTTSVLTLAATGASTINNANLTFNLNSAVAGQANVLNLGSTPVSFLDGNTTLTLNLVGTTVISAYTPYELITDTVGFGDSTSLVTKNEIIGGKTYDVIISGLSLASNQYFGATGAYNNSFLYIDSTGDNIDVMVVPEPGTWALMLGGLGLLLVWQRRKSRR